MPRTYRVTFEQVAVTVAQDLVTVESSSSKVCRILRQWVAPTDTTLVTSQSIAVRGRVLPATVTLGSGGTTPTPAPIDPGDAAAAFTAHANDTTKSTTSGTAVVKEEAGFHAYQGYDVTFAKPPIVGPSQAWVFELLSTVSGTVHLSGGLEVEEIG